MTSVSHSFTLVTMYELSRADYSNGFSLGLHAWPFPIACWIIDVSTPFCLYCNVENSVIKER